MAAVLSKQADERRSNFIAEIRCGEKEKDVLLNSSFPFEAERQALYFSFTRRNIKSDMAYATMHHSNNTDDMAIMEMVKNGKLCRDN